MSCKKFFNRWIVLSIATPILSVSAWATDPSPTPADVPAAPAAQVGDLTSADAAKYIKGFKVVKVGTDPASTLKVVGTTFNACRNDLEIIGDTSVAGEIAVRLRDKGNFRNCLKQFDGKSCDPHAGDNDAIKCSFLASFEGIDLSGVAAGKLGQLTLDESSQNADGSYVRTFTASAADAHKDQAQLDKEALAESVKEKRAEIAEHNKVFNTCTGNLDALSIFGDHVEQMESLVASLTDEEKSALSKDLAGFSASKLRKKQAQLEIAAFMSEVDKADTTERLSELSSQVQEWASNHNEQNFDAANVLDRIAARFEEHARNSGKTSGFEDAQKALKASAAIDPARRAAVDNKFKALEVAKVETRYSNYLNDWAMGTANPYEWNKIQMQQMKLARDLQNNANRICQADMKARRSMDNCSSAQALARDAANAQNKAKTEYMQTQQAIQAQNNAGQNGFPQQGMGQGGMGQNGFPQQGFPNQNGMGQGQMGGFAGLTALPSAFGGQQPQQSPITALPSGFQGSFPSFSNLQLNQGSGFGSMQGFTGNGFGNVNLGGAFSRNF